MAFNTAKALGKFNGGFQGQRDSIPIATVAEIDISVSEIDFPLRIINDLERKAVL
jgi:hypothetical protein